MHNIFCTNCLTYLPKHCKFQSGTRVDLSVIDVFWKFYLHYINEGLVHNVIKSSSDFFLLKYNERL